jgi:16S rRNA processing protein RimM
MIGFDVTNQHNEKLGVVDYFVETGSNNVLVTKGKKEYWIPYIEPFLISTNAETKQIIVDWDEDF